MCNAKAIAAMLVYIAERQTRGHPWDTSHAVKKDHKILPDAALTLMRLKINSLLYRMYFLQFVSLTLRVGYVQSPQCFRYFHFWSWTVL